MRTQELQTRKIGQMYIFILTNAQISSTIILTQWKKSDGDGFRVQSSEVGREYNGTHAAEET